MTDVIREWTEAVTWQTAVLRENQIKLALQPKPRWLPEKVWHRVIARLLVIEERVN